MFNSLLDMVSKDLNILLKIELVIFNHERLVTKITWNMSLSKVKENHASIAC